MDDNITAKRLKDIMREKNLKQVDVLKLAKPFCDKYNVKLGRNDLSQYLSGKVIPGQRKLMILGLALDVSPTWLGGLDVPAENNDLKKITTFDEFLDTIKYEEIDELVKADKEHDLNLINSLSIIDIMQLFSNTMMKKLINLYNYTEKIHKISLDIRNTINHSDHEITLDDNIIELVKNHNYYTLDEKKYKLLFFINKMYTEDELLERLSKSNSFKIIDKKTNQEICDVARRKEAIKLYIYEIIKSSKQNQDK